MPKKYFSVWLRKCLCEYQKCCYTAEIFVLFMLEMKTNEPKRTKHKESNGAKERE